MIGEVQFKVCGLTSAEDAIVAAQAGADYLGFIFVPKSPRAMTLAKYATFAGRLPDRKKVAVTVLPTREELAAFLAAGFDRFQIHFPADHAPEKVRLWTEQVGADRLWLTPKLPPGVDVPAALLPLADSFMLDTFDVEKFGGTGRTGDWGKFARHQRNHPTKRWILSGGLAPENVAEALKATGTRFIDVNSGVESSPGKKDPAKIAALVKAAAKT